MLKANKIPTSRRPELIILSGSGFRTHIDVINPETNDYVAKRFTIDSRLPFAKRLTTINDEYKSLMTDKMTRELVEWTLKFLANPTVLMEARMLSYLDMIERTFIEKLLPEPADTNDIEALQKVFGFSIIS